MSFEKSQYADSKENSSPIIFDFKDDNSKVCKYCFKYLVTMLTDF